MDFNFIKDKRRMDAKKEAKFSKPVKLIDTKAGTTAKLGALGLVGVIGLSLFTVVSLDNYFHDGKSVIPRDNALGRYLDSPQMKLAHARFMGWLPHSNRELRQKHEP